MADSPQPPTIFQNAPPTPAETTLALDASGYDESTGVGVVLGRDAAGVVRLRWRVSPTGPVVCVCDGPKG